MTNQNFTGHHLREEAPSAPGIVTTQDVLSDQLGHFASREKEEFLATQHELTTGQILQRSWESEGEYRARAKKFRKENGVAPAKPGLTMDPIRARRELERMERSHRKTPIPTEKDRLAKRREDWRYMNELRAVISAEPFDYEKTPLPDPAAETAKRYNQFASHKDPDQRKSLCAVSPDLEVIKLVMQHDADDRVRAAAETRYGQLLAGGGRG